MPIGQNLPSLMTRLLTVLAFVLPIALIVHAVAFWGHGIIDSEAMEFVLNYLQKRPFLVQIFDPQINDWGAYQARELSYVFDFVDARLFAALLDRHFLVFVPLSGVFGLIAVSAIYFWGARKVFGLDLITICLLLSLFLSCIVVQTSTPILYRSSKIILCVALLAFLFYLFALLKAGHGVTLPKSAALFFLGLIMALCDRQGFFYLISTTLIALLIWLIAKARRASIHRTYLPVVGANVAAIVATIFYNRVLAPRLIHSLNGYWPDFTYQNLPLSALLDPTLASKTWYLFQEQVSFFFGSVPFVVLAAIMLIGAILSAWKYRDALDRTNLTLVTVSLFSVFAVIGLLAVMIARHPQLYSIRDHAFWYYFLTVHAVFLFGISAWIGLLSPAIRSRLRPTLYGLIAILIVLNIHAYGQQRQTITTGDGWFAGQFEHSQALVSQFAAAPPDRDKLLAQTGDSFLDDQEHFLENVERSYLHLTGALETRSPDPR